MNMKDFILCLGIGLPLKSSYSSIVEFDFWDFVPQKHSELVK